MDEVSDPQPLLGELTDGEHRPVNRYRGHNRVDSRAVEQACIAERLANVHPTPDGSHDQVDHLEQMFGVAEAYVGEHDPALGFNVDHVRAYHHDLGEAVVLNQHPQRAESLEVTLHALQPFLFGRDRAH